MGKLLVNQIPRKLFTLAIFLTALLYLENGGQAIADEETARAAATEPERYRAPIIPPPSVPIGPIMPVRRPEFQNGTALSQMEVEEEPRKESLWQKLAGWFKKK